MPIILNLISNIDHTVLFNLPFMDLDDVDLLG